MTAGRVNRLSGLVELRDASDPSVAAVAGSEAGDPSRSSTVTWWSSRAKHGCHQPDHASAAHHDSCHRHFLCEFALHVGLRAGDDDARIKIGEQYGPTRVASTTTLRSRTPPTTRIRCTTPVP